MTFEEVLKANAAVDKPLDAINNKAVEVGAAPFVVKADPIKTLSIPTLDTDAPSTLEGLSELKDDAGAGTFESILGSSGQFDPLIEALPPSIDSIAKFGVGGGAVGGYSEGQVREVLRKVLRMV
jgi:hypothetical protein